MIRRCRPRVDENGHFLPNGQSRKRGLNRSIADASWHELTQKIDYMAVKSGKILIKVNPKHTSQKCHACGYVDATNREKEKFICVSCGYMAHADINAAKNIRELAFEVLRDLQEPEPKGSKRPKNYKEKSARSTSKSVEPGNLSNKDIRVEIL